MRLVLASQSPSRRMLLEQGGVEPVLRPAHIDEEAVIASLIDAPPATTVATLARAKALAGALAVLIVWLTGGENEKPPTSATEMGGSLCPRQDSNLRPSAPEADALSTELPGPEA